RRAGCPAAQSVRAGPSAMKVLVTGASGFVGRALVTTLAPHEVRAAVRRGGSSGFPAAIEAARHADLATPLDWGPLLTDVDAAVHLAGIAHTGQNVADARYDRINHLATAELAAAAKRSGVKRLIFLSSVRAQSGPTTAHQLTELDEPRPTDAYSRSKLAAET